MKINNIQDISSAISHHKKVVFITGVTGQDGSTMTDYLLRETDVDVVGGARRLSVENHTNISHLENEHRFQLINFDLTDSHSIYKVMEYVKPDYFINFAAQSFVASSWDFARQTWESNSTAVLDCLEAIKRINPKCRFYNAGSSEEFGNVLYEPQDEAHPSRPRSPYGASKASARTLIKVYRESYNLYAIQGLVFNHEGVRRGDEFVTRKITKAVARISKAIEEGKRFEPLELGNIEAQRDWSDAEDIVDAVWRMMNQEKYNEKLNKEHFEEWYELYNEEKNKKQVTEWESKRIKDYVVGSGEKHTIKEFIEKSFNIAGIKWVYYIDENKNPLSEKYYLRVDDRISSNILVRINPKLYRPAEVDALRSNPTKIKEELGWKPKTTFDELVKKMVRNDLTLLKSVI